MSQTLPTLQPIGQFTNTLRSGLKNGNPQQKNGDDRTKWIQAAEALDALHNGVSSALSFAQSAASSIVIPSGIGGGDFVGSGTVFAPNFANGHTQELTLTGDATINAAIGPIVPGDEMVIVLIQDSTGGWQVTSWDASYLFPGTFGLDPTPATATVFTFRVNSASHLFLKCPPVTGITPWP